jgi:FkbM family methyltransferase
MAILKNLLARHPGFETFLAPVYHRLYGEPPVVWPKHVMVHLPALLGRPNPVIVEAGCNDGEHTRWFADAFERPTIYCFEPDRRAIRRFRANLGRRSNIQLFEMALSDHAGKIDFYPSGGSGDGKTTPPSPGEWDYSGSIRRPKEHLDVYPSVTFDSVTKIEATTLDLWRREREVEVIDLLWMDVQGAEMDVFRGAAESLKRTRYIFTEYSNQEFYEGQLSLPHLLNYLKGYEVVYRCTEDVLFKNTKLTS